jgi:hypothetical protein
MIMDVCFDAKYLSIRRGVMSRIVRHNVMRCLNTIYTRACTLKDRTSALHTTARFTDPPVDVFTQSIEAFTPLPATLHRAHYDDEVKQYLEKTSKAAKKMEAITFVKAELPRPQEGRRRSETRSQTKPWTKKKESLEVKSASMMIGATRPFVVQEEGVDHETVHVYADGSCELAEKKMAWGLAMEPNADRDRSEARGKLRLLASTSSMLAEMAAIAQTLTMVATHVPVVSCCYQILFRLMTYVDLLNTGIRLLFTTGEKRLFEYSIKKLSL